MVYTVKKISDLPCLQPRYVVNQVTAGDYDCPRKVLKFLTDLHAAFRMLNLRNDFLRKKFDGEPITLVYLMQSEMNKGLAFLFYTSLTC